MVQEVWEVVDQNYLDARGSGFDRARWAAVGTLPSAAIRCHTDDVRRMSF